MTLYSRHYLMNNMSMVVNAFTSPANTSFAGLVCVTVCHGACHLVACQSSSLFREFSNQTDSQIHSSSTYSIKKWSMSSLHHEPHPPHIPWAVVCRACQTTVDRFHEPDPCASPPFVPPPHVCACYRSRRAAKHVLLCVGSLCFSRHVCSKKVSASSKGGVMRRVSMGRFDRCRFLFEPGFVSFRTRNRTGSTVG